MRLGLFGGTFSPFHCGHYDALRHFIDLVKPDLTLVMPAGIPPHKQVDDGAGDEDRVAMTRLAVGDLAEVSLYEMRKQGKCYAVETLEYLHETYPDAEIFLYMGSDMLLCFERVWYRFEDILKTATLTVLSRTGDDYDELNGYAAHLRDAYGAKVIVGTEKPLVISSTEIRERLRDGRPTDGLLDPRVYAYICEHHLYGVKL